jgi:hypothetical protein
MGLITPLPLLNLTFINLQTLFYKARDDRSDYFINEKGVAPSICFIKIKNFDLAFMQKFWLGLSNFAKHLQTHKNK